MSRFLPADSDILIWGVSEILTTTRRFPRRLRMYKTIAVTMAVATATIKAFKTSVPIIDLMSRDEVRKNVPSWEALSICESTLLMLRTRPTSKLTGRGDYIQPSNQTINLRKKLPALRSNDLFGVSYHSIKKGR